MGENNDLKFDKLLNSFIKTAKDITENIVEKGSEFAKDSGMKDLKDYYPFYSWPPLNLYQTHTNELVFEFALPGYIKDDVDIDFDGDYLLFSAEISNNIENGDILRSFKSKVKFSPIVKQKYYLPENKYDRKDYIFKMKNGLLRIVFKELEISHEIQ